MNSYRNIIIFFIFIQTYINATINVQKYDIQSAKVDYVINGGGVLTSEMNLTVKGTENLYFKEWGKVELFKKLVDEKASGTVNTIETIQICQKIDKNKKLDVDFKNKKILERYITQANKDSVTKGLVKKGQKEILGYKCDIWEGDGIKKCIYKGIPLLVEYDLLGIMYQKKAVSLTVDINSSFSPCKIPAYPIQKFALFKNNTKTTSKKPSETFLKHLLLISKEYYRVLKSKHTKQKNISLQKRKYWLNKLGENIFKKQKVLLPKLLLSMKKARICLQEAKNWVDANVCIEDVVLIKKHFTKDKESEIGLWKGNKRQKVLDTFDTNISLLESKMRCIRSSQNITDLSNCMK